MDLNILNNPIVVGIVLVFVASAAYFYFRVLPFWTESHIKHGNIEKHTYGDYEVLEIRDILTKDQCKRLMEIAEKQGMTPSEVIDYGAKGDRATNTGFRKSVQAWLKDSTDPLTMRLAEYTEKMTGYPRANQEMVQIVKYDEGGQFIQHYDACDHVDQEYCARVNHWAGHRRATLLIYLNDDFEGGETEFTKLGLKIKPEAGKGILFWSTKEDDKIIEKSMHQGHPVKNGNKWIATKWTHPGEWHDTIVIPEGATKPTWAK